MTAYTPNLPPAAVHSHLRKSLKELRQAEKNAVLWFGEVMSRKLYRSVGCSSIQQYAAVHLNFKKSKTSQFIRLSYALETLPRLKQSVAKGEVSWTKAREVSKVATPGNEKDWVAVARKSSRRELEKKVELARGRAKAERKRNKNQVVLTVLSGGSGTDGDTNPGSDSGVNSGLGGAAVLDLASPSPVHAGLRFTPEQYARYESLVEKLRKCGWKGSREELFLAGLEALVLGEPKPEAMAGDAPDLGVAAGASGPRTTSTQHADISTLNGKTRKFTRVTRVNSGSPYQVIVQVCEKCSTGKVTTSSGDRHLDPQTLGAILCDSRVLERGKRNRAMIPTHTRRLVVSRDRFRCRAPGCMRTSFLSVHHIVARAAGGSNDANNLITLCSGCHRTIHALGERGRNIRPSLTGSPGVPG